MNLRMFFAAVWQFIRELAGENDYERYLARAVARSEPVLAPADFYLARLEHKYLRPNRCC